MNQSACILRLLILFVIGIPPVTTTLANADAWDDSIGNGLINPGTVALSMDHIEYFTRLNTKQSVDL